MKALAEYLKRTETSQAAFARQIGVSQPTVSNLVNGTHSATSTLLKKISKATGLSADKLLADIAEHSSHVA